MFFIDEDEIVITKKEDLINTYIEKGNQELTNLYLDACEPYINVYLCRADRFPEDSHFYFNPSVEHIQSGECDTERYKKLTLSDLKPRTRTEYEKVTESIFDLRDEFESGELYNESLDGSGEFVNTTSEVVLCACINSVGIYRRVETEIDERQEFIERAKGLIVEGFTVDYSLEKMYDAGCRFQD